MGRKMQDGTIVPSHMKLKTTASDKSSFVLKHKNESLHVGSIVAVYPPNDVNNKNKRLYEYDVLCYTNEPNKTNSPMLYRHCVVSNQFGTVADFTDFTLRADKAGLTNGAYTSKGAAVLLLCVEGRS